MTLLGAGLAFREDLAFHYHVWRLDRALTVEDAEPWAQKLEDDFHDPSRAQCLVAMLGPRRPRLTYWIFELAYPLDPRDEIFPRVDWLLHLVRSLEDRLRSDEEFLALAGHFFRWKDNWWHLNWYLIPELSFTVPGEAIFAPGIAKHFLSEIARCQPTDQEALLRILEAQLLVEAWLLGMSPLPSVVELHFPVAPADLERLERHWGELRAWVCARRGRLRFDPALGRFVEVPAGQGSAETPRPTEPLPGWTGPVPQLGPQ